MHIAIFALAIGAVISAPTPAMATLENHGPWPSAVAAPPAQEPVESVVRIASTSPFTLRDAGSDAPSEQAVGYYVAPRHSAAAKPTPGVVLLHGAGGVIGARELTYARQFARQGVAALVIDAFASRRDRAHSFADRLIHITETMVLSDAFAGLDWLAGQPAVDATKVALIGFSYGGMASVFAAYRQVTDRLSRQGRQFAAHVAFYAPCIVRFEDPVTTGAPVLMLWGGQDEIVDAERCQFIAADLRRGGSQVEVVIYPDAMHQWDGRSNRPWRTPRGLAECSFSVGRDGSVSDNRTFLPMRGPTTRKLILAACADSRGYLIGRDDDVRQQSNAAVASFLNPILFPE